MVAQNGHENIIEFLGSQEDDKLKVMYIALEMCDMDLKTHMDMQRTNLRAHNLINYTCQVTNGICHLHQLNVAHRDIKPQNVLVKETAEGVILKVSDFGGSKEMEQQETQTGNDYYYHN